MKKVVIALIVFAFSANSLWCFYDTNDKLNYSSCPENDPMSVTEIPKKWENESAVIISQQYKFIYLRDNLKNRVLETTQRRIKLLDKAAVDLFSEIYYIDNSIDSLLIIKIIKPDNTIINIDSRNAVQATAEVPKVFRSNRFTTLNYKKLAIPNLEAGDIIEYSYSEQSSKVNGYSFFLMQTYPIMHQSFEFIIDKSFFLNFKAINGAPEIKYCGTARDYFGRERAIVQHYKVEDFDREKISESKWMNYYNDVPCIKFNASSSRRSATKDFISSDSEDYVFSGNIDESYIKKAVKLSSMLQIASTGGLNVYDVFRFLKNKITEGYSTEEAVELTYSQFRFYIYSYFYPFSKEIDEADYFNQFVFCNYFSSILEKNNIDVDFVVAPSRADGNFDKIASVLELNIGLRIQLDKDYYIFPFTGFSCYDDIPFQIEGVEAIVYEDIYKKNNMSSERIKLPVSKAEDNTHYTQTNLVINNDFETLNVNRKIDITGNMRFDYGDLYLNYISLYLMDTKRFLKDNAIITKSSPNIYALKNNMKNIIDNENSDQTLVINNIEEFYKEKYEFSIKDYNWLDYNNKNVDSIRKIISITESFSVPDYIDPVGNDYSINIGSFTGKQVKISPDEQIRSCDIFFDYAKTYDNLITCNIPEGYYVANEQSFNFNIDNESGSFVSEASIVDNKLIIRSSKIYKRNFDSAAKWSNYIEFTDAAYTFSQTKLILKSSK